MTTSPPHVEDTSTAPVPAVAGARPPARGQQPAAGSLLAAVARRRTS